MSREQQKACHPEAVSEFSFLASPSESGFAARPGFTVGGSEAGYVLHHAAIRSEASRSVAAAVMCLLCLDCMHAR
jgi:hypothetical protein